MLQRFRALTPVLALLFISSLHTTASAQDVVQVTNGDRITGTVEELERGDLAFDTAAAGTIDITWAEVVRLTTTQMVDVELSSGMRYTGTISSPADGQLVITTASGPTMPIPLTDVAHIRVIGATFIERTSGSADFGFMWLQGAATTLTFDGEANNRTRSFETELKVESWLSDQNEGVTKTRNNLELDVRRLLSGRWYAMALANYHQDDEMELDWRTVFGGGFGKWLIDSSTNELKLEGGLDYNAERFTGAGETDHSAELFGAVGWEWSPTGPTEVSVDARTEVSLDRQRIRLEFEGELRRDIFWDLYWSVRAFDDLDSDPPDDRPQSAFGVAFALGWSF